MCCLFIFIYRTERINENYQKQHKLQYTSIILWILRGLVSLPSGSAIKTVFSNAEFVTMSWCAHVYVVVCPFFLYQLCRFRSRINMQRQRNQQNVKYCIEFVQERKQYQQKQWICAPRIDSFTLILPFTNR